MKFIHRSTFLLYFFFHFRYGSIGKNISTKLPIGQKPTGDDVYNIDRMDITDLYKYGEGMYYYVTFISPISDEYCVIGSY